jgi:hypothetical protein
MGLPILTKVVIGWRIREMVVGLEGLTLWKRHENSHAQRSREGDGERYSVITDEANASACTRPRDDM